MRNLRHLLHHLVINPLCFLIIAGIIGPAVIIHIDRGQSTVLFDLVQRALPKAQTQRDHDNDRSRSDDNAQDRQRRSKFPAQQIGRAHSEQVKISHPLLLLL